PARPSPSLERPARAMRDHRLWVWSLVGWTAVGIFVFAQRALFRYSLHEPPGLDDLGPTLASMWLWAAFTPPIFVLADTLPISRSNWRRRVPLHVLLGMGTAVADTVVSNGLLRPLLGWPERSYLTYLASELFVCTFSYGLLVAIRQAMNAYRLAAERRLRASELETELARAHLRALQMQLRPHFLFNALHTVAALVRGGESRAAVRTLSELGEFLRWVLEQDDAQLVPLRRELDLLDRYLRIEQIRFQDRLTTQVDVEPRALEALVPTLILQPLVENAVHHGLASATRPGRIDVSVHVDAPMLCIEVRDSGSGPSPSGRQGVGLGNTRARLERLYGSDHVFELRPCAAGGAVAQLRIPFRPAVRS
ncbi:MAG TPA: histidine kinase, partial [Myxococcaceae bacterium]|nr:histidine kinase [Myxococcaceae bacterium]